MKTQGHSTDIVFLSGVRTGFGAFGGALKSYSAIQLGAIAAKHAMERAGTDITVIDHVVFGNALQTLAPAAGGILVFSRLNIYYLTGTYGQGVLWLPLSGEPVLMIRKGVNRALLESPLKNIVSFKSYSALAPLCAEAGVITSYSIHYTKLYD